MPDDDLWETRRRAQFALDAANAAIRAARCRRCWLKAWLWRGVALARLGRVG